jgi:TonB family protein
MKTLSLTIIVLLFFVKAHSQETASTDSAIVNLKTFFKRQAHPPAVAVENNVQGTVVISFKIDDDKNITDIHVEKSLSSECDKEALRVFYAYHQPISLPPAEYTVGVTFLMVNKKGLSVTPPFDKSPYKNFLFEVEIIHMSN